MTLYKFGTVNRYHGAIKTDLGSMAKCSNSWCLILKSFMIVLGLISFKLLSCEYVLSGLGACKTDFGSVLKYSKYACISYNVDILFSVQMYVCVLICIVLFMCTYFLLLKRLWTVWHRCHINLFHYYYYLLWLIVFMFVQLSGLRGLVDIK